MNKEKILLIFLGVFVVIVLLIGAYFFFSAGEKTLSLVAPVGEERWEIGQKYNIEWRSENIDRVGIVLFDSDGMEWIGKNIDARLGKFEWDIYSGHDYGYGFWVAVFEYPWRPGNKVDYSDGAFSITYPELAGCDNLSIGSEWPYLASDFPGVRKVFITDNLYNGNLDGFVGADRKCQAEAEEIGYSGEWQAFLGGDADDQTALARLIETNRGFAGIFVQAEPSASLIRGATCHRLLGRSLDKFMERFADPIILASSRIDEDFLEKMQNIWLGRISAGSARSCIVKAGQPSSRVAEDYSITSTCQNWTRSEKFVSNYDGSSVSGFPTCYTPSGTPTAAVALEGLSTGLISGQTSPHQRGSYCDAGKRLLCIEK